MEKRTPEVARREPPNCGRDRSCYTGVVDVLLRELAEVLAERIDDRFGRGVAWIATVAMVLLLTAGVVWIGVLILR